MNKIELDKSKLYIGFPIEGREQAQWLIDWLISYDFRLYMICFWRAFWSRLRELVELKIRSTSIKITARIYGYWYRSKEKIKLEIKWFRIGHPDYKTATHCQIGRLVNKYIIKRWIK